MHRLDALSIINRYTVLLFALIYFFPAHTATVHAQAVQLDRLDRNYKVKRSDGTRLGRLKNKNCRNCSEKSTIRKAEYLKRVVTDHDSNAYQRVVEQHIFSDSKFVNGCWKDAIDKGMEFFFTVSKSGKPIDFAWFPQEYAGKCIKRHISKLDFPKVDKPHHAWLLVTGQEY